MIDPNVPSFFLIILSGFGVVWSFRLFSKTNHKSLGDFEYLAFSTIWGSVLFITILINLSNNTKVYIDVMTYPFIATPILFIFGVICGSIFGIMTSYVVKTSLIKKILKSRDNL